MNIHYELNPRHTKSQICREHLCCEINGALLTENDLNGQSKDTVIQQNEARLLQYTEMIFERIVNSNRSLPTLLRLLLADMRNLTVKVFCLLLCIFFHNNLIYF